MAIAQPRTPFELLFLPTADDCAGTVALPAETAEKVATGPGLFEFFRTSLVAKMQAPTTPPPPAAAQVCTGPPLTATRGTIREEDEDAHTAELDAVNAKCTGLEQQGTRSCLCFALCAKGCLRARPVPPAS